MNQAEAEYADLLQARKLAEQIHEWYFEAVTLKLAKLCTFTPDFMVYCGNGEIEFVDVKGGGPIDDKSVVKIKVAAEKFPQFRFVQEKKRAKRDGGGFERREF